MRQLQERLFIGLFLVIGVDLLAEPSFSGSDLVPLRKQDMKDISAAAKAISDMFLDPTTYDAQAFGNAAQTISAKSGQTIIKHFNFEVPAAGSDAKANILEEGDHFARLADDLKAYADALGAAAQKNPGEMTGDMRMKPGKPLGGGPFGTDVSAERLGSIPAEHSFHLMLQTCKVCHARFREKHQ
jgi:cytochrome c556